MKQYERSHETIICENLKYILTKGRDPRGYWAAIDLERDLVNRNYCFYLCLINNNAYWKKWNAHKPYKHFCDSLSKLDQLVKDNLPPKETIYEIYKKSIMSILK